MRIKPTYKHLRQIIQEEITDSFGNTIYIMYATKIGDEDWKEQLITETKPEWSEEQIIQHLQKAKKWAIDNGFDRIRINTFTPGEIPDFTRTINQKSVNKLSNKQTDKILKMFNKKKSIKENIDKDLYNDYNDLYIDNASDVASNFINGNLKDVENSIISTFKQPGGIRAGIILLMDIFEYLETYIGERELNKFKLFLRNNLS